MFIIDDSTSNDIVFDGQYSRGLVPRDMNEYPAQMFAPPSQMPLIPESEWEPRIKEQTELKSSIAHRRMTANNGKKMWALDQDGFGYCWGHSVAHTIMLQRAMAGLPFVELSAFSICAPVKNGRDEGGWCGLAAERARTHGIATTGYWRQGVANTSLWTSECAENALLHRITEDWVDLARPVYDQNLTWAQVISCLLLGIPVALDYNWWGHSVAGMRAVIVEPGSIGIEILNSWYIQPGVKEWGDQGTSVLRGERAKPNGAVATAVTVGSAA